MKILALTGSLRAGKSTLIEETIRQGMLTGILEANRVAWLLNDRPSPDGRMVDGHNVREIARVIPFPNRCFTCEDTGKLAEMIRGLAEMGDIDMVFIEGYGFVAGSETREALEATGYPFAIFALADAEHWQENHAAYGPVIQSQLAAATMGIGLTHIGDETETILDAVSAFAPVGVQVMPLPKGSAVPSRLLLPFLATEQTACAHGCSHHHKHTHHYEHHHDVHDEFFTVTYPLRREVALQELKEALRDVPVLRGKGVVAGRRFDLLHGAWNVGDPVDQPGILTIYSQGKEISIPGVLIDHEARAMPEGSTKVLLRQDVDPEAAQAALERLAAQIPLEPVVLPGMDGLRVAAQLEELQLLKQIAQRPSIKDAWLLEAVHIALRYWTACARFIEAHEVEMDPAELPISRLELGLSLGWWTNRFESDLAPDVVAAVVACRVGNLLALGLRDAPPLSAKKTAAQAEYYRDVAQFALRHGESPRVLAAYI